MRMTIGEMAKLNNVSVPTLRYYDEIGLLKPKEVDTSSNYRYYDEYDCCTLSKIKVLKEIGLPLKQIKLMLEGTLDEVEQSLCNIRDEVTEKMKNLNELKLYLDEQLDLIMDMKKGQCYIEPQIIHFQEREGFIIDVCDSTTLVQSIAEIVKFEKSNNTNADIFFRPSRLMGIKPNGAAYLKKFIAIKRGESSGKLDTLFVLKEGYYAVIDHIGNCRDIKKSYNKLYQYAEQNGLILDKESIEILAVSSNLTIESDENRTQIQVLVKNNVNNKRERKV